MDDKLDLKSLDIKDDKIEQLKKAFPEVVSEGKVDFEKLKLSLGEEIEVGKERYGMNWPGKANCFKIIQDPSIGTLKPIKEDSVDFDTTENLFIEGDSLEVLKLLQKSYYGKIKMIYIDPPYNTGNDFVYPDNFSESLDTYLRYTGQKGEAGLKLTTNAETEGRYHSKWMNMMYPRLFLARNLMKEDGVIFISIDDHEVENLRKICNELFGEENFIASFIWKSRQNTDSRTLTGVSSDHEYILCYVKTQDSKLKGKEIDKTKYSNPDGDARGSWMSSPLDGIATKDKRPNLHYTLINPTTNIAYEPNPNNGWRFQKSSMDNLINEDRILWPRNPNSKPRFKRYLNELGSHFTGFSTVLNTVYTTTGTRELRDLMGMETLKFPKPIDLIRLLLEQSNDKDSIIMDFFAGSATTAHAAIAQNNEDGGDRKFIMVQLQEPTEEDSEAYKAGYINIAEIGKERIRRATKKIKEENKGKLGFEDRKQDLGFKVFRLDESNFKIWDKQSDVPIQQQLQLSISNINDDSSDEEILYEIILKSGFELSVPVEKLEIQGKTVFSVDNKSLLICLENDLTQEFMKELSQMEAGRVVCLDRGFHNNDQLKTNTVELMKAKSVEFKTV